MSRRLEVLLDACLVAAVALAALLCLRQSTFYKDDGDVYLQSIAEGQLQHPHHMLYKPLVAATHRAMAGFGLSLYEAAVLLSALGTAVGLACALAASRRLGLARRASFAVPALMLSVPALLFFGTVVELHGVFLGFAGPSFLATAALARAPGVRTGCWFGLALSLAYVGHASGVLLPAVLLPLALHYPGTTPVTPPWTRARALRLPVALAAVTFGAFLLALPALGRLTGLGVDASSAAAYVARDAATFAADPNRWWTTLWYEWLAPYAPWNTLALACCCVGSQRGPARWIWIAAIPYYLVCVFLLPDAEFGAYFTPFAWPLALLALAAAPRACMPLALVGAGLGIGWVGTHDRPELAQRFAAGARAASGASALALLLGDHADTKATLIALPDVPRLLVLHAGVVPPAALSAAVDSLDLWLAARWAEGCAVLLTDGAVRMLETVAPSGPLLLPALRARYRLERCDVADHAAEFHGWRLSRL